MSLTEVENCIFPLAFSDDVVSFLEELGAFLEGHLANLDVVSMNQWHKVYQI